MYKIFHGFHLVEAYQDLKKARRLAKNQAVARCIKLTVAITISLILWLLPIDTFGIEGLTVIEQRLISIFIFATLMWVFEAVPAWTTSVLIVVLLLLTVSDSSLWFLTQDIPAGELGQTVKYKSIMHCFADPIIMLFIGGFILAIAATKSGLDVLLARVMLRPFGTQSRYVLFRIHSCYGCIFNVPQQHGYSCHDAHFPHPCIKGTSGRRQRKNRSGHGHSRSC